MLNIGMLRKSLKIRQIDFCDKFGLSQSYLSEIENFKKPIPEELYRNIIEEFGQLIVDKFSIDEKQPKPTLTERVIGKTIKYYPTVNGSMGGIEFLDSPDESFVDIVIPGFSDCEFAINAYGDSMYPVIKSGQVVLLMPWKEKFIEWGRIYLVITKSGYRMIKYIKPSKNDGCVVCESENKEESPAFEIEKDEILKLFLVKGWICKDAI